MKKINLRDSFVGGVGSFLFLYLFYKSLVVSVIGVFPGMVAYVWYQKKCNQEKIRWQLMVEFKDAMDSLVSALVAGYSMENAVQEAYHDLKMMYGRQTPILQELEEILAKLRLKVPLDQLFLELGRTSEVEDIITFAQIYSTARRSGGNLAKVMRRTAQNIGEKIEIQRDIQTMIAGKKMESTCMMVIPLLIILYMQFFSPGFLDPLYQGIRGRLFMTIALFVYAGAVLWSRKIMNMKC